MTTQPAQEHLEDEEPEIPETIEEPGYSKSNGPAVAEHVRNLRLVEANQAPSKSFGLTDLMLGAAALPLNLLVGSVRLATAPTRFVMSFLD